MKLASILVVQLLTLCGCHHPNSSTKVVHPASPTDYPGFVGQRIELVGVVTQTKCPQILGVDLWELEEFRGRKLKVTGILRQSVITQASLDDAERQLGGPFANRGPGMFYHLEELKYAPVP